MTTYKTPTHSWEMEVPLDIDGEALRRILRIEAEPAPEVKAVADLTGNLPCTILRYYGFAPRNGQGYVVDGEQYIVHLDIADQQFWVTSKIAEEKAHD